MPRFDGRAPHQIRPVKITRRYLEFAEGSCLCEFGRTKVICTASVSDEVPRFALPGRGWITAEYGMLPKSCSQRVNRDSSRNSGRTMEIQRLIGRSLRAITNLSLLGEKTITVDCDVLQADGGTRTAAITGAYIALHDCLSLLKSSGIISSWPLEDSVAGVSVGIVDGIHVLDLNYKEDSVAEVDFNVVMTGKGRFVEVQGTAEAKTFSQEDLSGIIELAKGGILSLTHIQNEALKG